MMMRRRRKMEASQFGNKLMKWFEGGGGVMSIIELVDVSSITTTVIIMIQPTMTMIVAIKLS